MSDLIFGLHSIAEALKNPKRENAVLYGTEESIKDLRKAHFKGQNLPDIKVHTLSLHKFKEEGKLCLKERGLKEQRVPSNIFLIADRIETVTVSSLYSVLTSAPAEKKFNLLALDQVTDVHNLAAISRTAAFYNVDYIIYARKNNDALSPGFYRISSGASEYVPMIQVNNLSKVIRKLMSLDVECVGLAEEGDSVRVTENNSRLCLVLGTEETGLSNAVRRTMETFVRLEAKGPIKSLNVSVAAALAMEKFLLKD